MKIIFTFLLLLMIFFTCNRAPHTRVKKPDFIFIYTDDQRQDAAGFNGNNVIITPELDHYTQKGIRFTNANVVFTLCSSSRAAPLTWKIIQLFNLYWLK